MNKLQEIKFYFLGWNFGALSLVVFCLLVVLWFSFNIPVGEEQKFKGKVITLGVTNGSKYNAANPTARVQLSTGKQVDIVLPKFTTVEPGEEIVVLKQGLFLKGGIYKYDHLPNNP